MGMNPELGDLRELTEEFSRDEATEKGYTSFFQVGELLKIRDCYFTINNFVEAHNFMNLKATKNDDALLMLSQMLPKAEIYATPETLKEIVKEHLP